MSRFELPAEDPYIPPPPTSGAQLMRAWPADVLAFLRRYSAAAAAGDMLAAVEARRGWPDGLLDCSCMSGEVEGPDGRAYACGKCGGVGLYYQPEIREHIAADAKGDAIDTRPAPTTSPA